ncbi:hypothetical protein [Mycoplasma suis]|uniref:Uncharacterized protein n=2 Tax=Mycoplasma suis (strain Illinois) TaxID=768700 RepID=F0QQ84_MYCSL|nr:hypothetical protein [Mycoplasma suis]ADX97654.1 hypothetical protein MSU_0110 [Mycoplasma suis str. Illinois]
MLGSAKIATAIFSLGSVVGGSYFLGSNLLSVKDSLPAKNDPSKVVPSLPIDESKNLETTHKSLVPESTKKEDDEEHHPKEITKSPDDDKASSSESGKSDRSTPDSIVSGRLETRYEFGSDKKPDPEVFAELIISAGGNSWTEGIDKFCIKVEKGVGTDIGNEQSKEWVSKNLDSREEEKKSKVWIKSKNEEHLKTVLKGFATFNNWFNGEEKLQVSSQWETLTCSKREQNISLNSGESKEIIVSCS